MAGGPCFGKSEPFRVSSSLITVASRTVCGLSPRCPHLFAGHSPLGVARRSFQFLGAIETVKVLPRRLSHPLHQRCRSTSSSLVYGGLPCCNSVGARRMTWSTSTAHIGAGGRAFSANRDRAECPHLPGSACCARPRIGVAVSQQVPHPLQLRRLRSGTLKGGRFRRRRRSQGVVLASVLSLRRA